MSLTDADRESFIAYRHAEYPDYHVLRDATFARTKVKPRIAEEHDGVSSLISAVEAGQGVALVTESLGCLAGRRLKLVLLTPNPPPLVIGACSLKVRLPPVAQVFLRVVSETTVAANG